MSRELSPADAITIWRLWRLMREFRPDIVYDLTGDVRERVETASRVH